MPQDLGRHFTAVQTLDTVWSDEGLWSAVVMAASLQGGWLHTGLAGLQVVFGPSIVAMEVVQWGLLAVQTVALAVLAQRMVGPRAAWATVALWSAIPATVLYSRVLWIHGPEAALLATSLALWSLDPRLSRWRTACAHALLGALAITLRPSGLVWVATLAPALAVGARCGGWTRGGFIVGSWAAAALHMAPQLGDYLDVKGGGGGTREPVRWIASQLADTWGPVAGTVAIAGLLAAGVRHVRAPTSGLPGPKPVWWVIGLWGVLPLILMLRYRVGLRDFPVFFLAIALIAGLGIAHVSALRVAVLGTWFLSVASSTLGHGAVGDGLRAVWGRPYDAPTTQWDTRGAGLSARTLGALFEASCPPAGACRVLAPEGLTTSLNEEFGQLELYLLGLHKGVQTVELRALGDHPPGGWERWKPHVLVAWDCPATRDRWIRFHPDLPRRAAALSTVLDAQPAWSTDVGPECRVYWLLPGGGRWKRPERAPSARSATEPWDPTRLDRVTAELVRGEPELARRIHLPRARHRPR